MDTIVFEITWAPLETATLVVLADNGAVVIPIIIPEVSGTGAVVVTYAAANAPAHTITWTLEFPTKTLTALRAYGSLNGGPRRLLDEKDSQTNSWSTQGVLW